MPKKLNLFEQDILSLLQRVEPDMLLWREINARLWPLHGRKYKDKKVFGVALSNYLVKLEGKFLKHEGDYWGTLRSSLPRTETQSIEEKESKPSHFGFFEWLKWRKQYVDEKLDRNIRELECRIAIRHELMHLDEDDPEYNRKANEIKFRLRKEHGLV